MSGRQPGAVTPSTPYVAHEVIEPCSTAVAQAWLEYAPHTCPDQQRPGGTDCFPLLHPASATRQNHPLQPICRR